MPLSVPSGVRFNDVLKDFNSRPGLISNALVACYKKPFINFTRSLTHNREINKYEGFTLHRGNFTTPEDFYNRVVSNAPDFQIKMLNDKM